MKKILRFIFLTIFGLNNNDILIADRGYYSNDLINKLNIFLLKYCSHEIVEDYIDLTPEKSKYIKYCVNCMNTFDV
jgi:hypothetical protein